MKRSAAVLTLVLVIAMTMGVCPVGAAESGDFTREDAIVLFKKAMECIGVLRDWGKYSFDRDPREAFAWFDIIYDDSGNIRACTLLYKNFDVSSSGEKYGLSIVYNKVNPSHKYGSIDKIKAWAESVFTARMANEVVMNNSWNYDLVENLRVDEDGTLWIKDATGRLTSPRYRNYLDFTVDGNRAVLKLEGKKRDNYYDIDNWYEMEIRYVKTSDGWRVAPSEFFTEYYSYITDEDSPETVDGTAARAAVFAAGAVLAAAVPALIMTVKHRREEN